MPFRAIMTPPSFAFVEMATIVYAGALVGALVIVTVSGGTGVRSGVAIGAVAGAFVGIVTGCMVGVAPACIVGITLVCPTVAVAVVPGGVSWPPAVTEGVVVAGTVACCVMNTVLLSCVKRGQLITPAKIMSPMTSRPDSAMATSRALGRCGFTLVLDTPVVGRRISVGSGVPGGSFLAWDDTTPSFGVKGGSETGTTRENAGGV